MRKGVKEKCLNLNAFEVVKRIKGGMERERLLLVPHTVSLVVQAFYLDRFSITSPLFGSFPHVSWESFLIFFSCLPASCSLIVSTTDKKTRTIFYPSFSTTRLQLIPSQTLQLLTPHRTICPQEHIDHSRSSFPPVSTSTQGASFFTRVPHPLSPSLPSMPYDQSVRTRLTCTIPDEKPQAM